MTHGKLYLVPAPLDFGCDIQAPLQDALPLGTLQVAAGITHWICENAKSARAYLKRIDAVAPLAAPLQAQNIQELPREVHKKGDHAGQFDARLLLAAALEGHDIGLLSEAGMPAVADPGPQWRAPRTTWALPWCHSLARSRCCSRWRRAA